MRKFQNKKYLKTIDSIKTEQLLPMQSENINHKNGWKDRMLQRMAGWKTWINRRMLCVLACYFSVMYLGWRIFFTLPFGNGWISLIGGIALLLVEIVGLFETWIHFHNMLGLKKYELPVIKDQEFPEVDVFIATYNEEPELLRKTINGCLGMKYPDLNKVHIWLCDDNRRAEMKALAEEMKIGYFDRPDNEGAKAGNLNAALARTSAPYVVTFDADMIPKEDFLLKTLPYFVEAEKINAGLAEEERMPLGLLQTPQHFYNPDLFQYNLYSEKRIPNEQDFFYKTIEVARTKTNSVIYGGSNTVISRAALDAVGGFYTNAITEDFATGLQIEKSGFVSLAIPDVLASGLSPADLPSLMQQRIRWARGVINTTRSLGILRSSRLSMGQKLNYLASNLYWYSSLKRLVYLTTPILYATFGIQVMNCTLKEMAVFWLPMAVMNALAIRLLSQNVRSTRWTSVYETIFFPFLLFPVLLETLGLKMKKFKVTQKTNVEQKWTVNLPYALPFIVLAFLSVLGLINCLLLILVKQNLAPIIVVLWLVNNLYALIMALFFVSGRSTSKNQEWFSRQVPVSIFWNRRIQLLKPVCLIPEKTGTASAAPVGEGCEKNQITDFDLVSGKNQVSANSLIPVKMDFHNRQNHENHSEDHIYRHNDLRVMNAAVPANGFMKLQETAGRFETLEISEDGLTFWSEHEIDKVSHSMTICLEHEGQKIELEAEIAEVQSGTHSRSIFRNVRKFKEKTGIAPAAGHQKGWKYFCLITKYTHGKDAWQQLVYSSKTDRAEKLSIDGWVAKDIWINIYSRVKLLFRKRPQVPHTLNSLPVHIVQNRKTYRGLLHGLGATHMIVDHIHGLKSGEPFEVHMNIRGKYFALQTAGGTHHKIYSEHAGCIEAESGMIMAKIAKTELLQEYHPLRPALAELVPCGTHIWNI